MTPIKFSHQQFLEDNKEILAAHPLPEMLQKRILGFEDLQEDLAHTTDEDREALLNKLEQLSYELDEDLEEYFEEYLENNDEEEPEHAAQLNEATGREHETILPPPPNPTSVHTSSTPDTYVPKAVQEEKVINRKQPPIEASGTTDEQIIDALVKNRITIIHPNELFKRGFKGVLGSRTVLAGKYSLQRGKYDISYRITLRGE